MEGAVSPEQWQKVKVIPVFKKGNFKTAKFIGVNVFLRVDIKFSQS